MDSWSWKMCVFSHVRTIFSPHKTLQQFHTLVIWNQFVSWAWRTSNYVVVFLFQCTICISCHEIVTMTLWRTINWYQTDSNLALRTSPISTFFCTRFSAVYLKIFVQPVCVSWHCSSGSRAGGVPDPRLNVRYDRDWCRPLLLDWPEDATEHLSAKVHFRQSTKEYNTLNLAPMQNGYKSTNNHFQQKLISSNTIIFVEGGKCVKFLGCDKKHRVRTERPDEPRVQVFLQESLALCARSKFQEEIKACGSSRCDFYSWRRKGMRRLFHTACVVRFKHHQPMGAELASLAVQTPIDLHADAVKLTVTTQ